MKKPLSKRKPYSPLFKFRHTLGDCVRVMAECRGMTMRQVFSSAVSDFLRESEEELGMSISEAVALSRKQRRELGRLSCFIYSSLGDMPIDGAPLELECSRYSDSAPTGTS